MRMRKKKNGAARLREQSAWLMEKQKAPMKEPAAYMGMTGAPVFVEIGAGKGGFATKMSELYPTAAYFAIERVSDCVVLAAEKAAATSSLEISTPFCSALCR